MRTTYSRHPLTAPITGLPIPHQKTFLTRALSRAYDGPVGDPFGGPAFGARGDPVTAVVAFVAENAVTIALVGTALSVVGAVTGDATLSKLGGVVGLVGGAFSLAQQGAFNFIDEGIQKWATDAATGFKSTAEMISTAADANAVTVASYSAPAEAAASGLVGEGAVASTAAPVETGSLNLAQDTSTVAAPAVDAAAPVAQAGEGVASAGPAADTLAESDALMGRYADATAGATDTAAQGVGANVLDEATAGAAKTSAAAAPRAPAAGAPAEVSKGVLDGIGKWVEKNKGLVEVGMKFGQGLLTDTESRDRAYDAQANAYNAKAELERQQMANASAVPNIQSMFSVNPNAQIQKPRAQYASTMRPGGLIQSR